MFRYKILTSAKNTDDSSIGFDRDRNERQRQLTNNKTQKGNFHLRFFQKIVLVLLKTRKKLLTVSDIK